MHRSPEIKKILKKRKIDPNINVETLKCKAQKQIINYLQLIMYKILQNDAQEEASENLILQANIANLMHQLKS